MKNSPRPRSAAQEAADEAHQQRVIELALAHDQECERKHKQYETRATILREAKRVLARPLLPEELDALLPPVSCYRTRQRAKRAERRVDE